MNPTLAKSKYKHGPHRKRERGMDNEHIHSQRVSINTDPTENGRGGWIMNTFTLKE
jgi:hypothetical protein